MLWASRAPSYPARMSRRRRATARPQKRLPTIYSSKSPWSSLLATTSRARDASGDHRRTVSLHAFDPRDRVLAAHQLHREPDLVTGFELLEHSGIPGLEHHRHRRHARFVMGPCFSVILPASRSTLRTSPSVSAAPGAAA